MVALAQLLILLNTQLAWYDGVTAVMAEFLGHDRRQLFSLLSHPGDTGTSEHRALNRLLLGTDAVSVAAAYIS